MKIRRPRRGSGVWGRREGELRGSPRSRSLSIEFWGEVGWDADRSPAAPGCPQGGQETQEAISGAIFDPRSTIFGPPLLFGELDKPRI